MKRSNGFSWLVAVALGVAALAATPAAAARVDGDAEGLLKFAYVGAYRYGGDQPVDLYAELIDEAGSPVKGATVTVDISTSRTTQPFKVHLEDQGSGVYMACDAAFLDGPPNAGLYTFQAEKEFMQPTEAMITSERDNLCGEGAPQIVVASAQVAKFDGKAPLSVVVELVDDGGYPVTRADVLVQVTGEREQIEKYLGETKDGRYGDCSVAVLDTTGPGQVEVMIYASAEGYRSAAAGAENTVGYLCTTPVQGPPPPPSTVSRTRALPQR
jgi:hypothetical protein